MTSLGTVTIECPTCHRHPSFPLHTTGPRIEGAAAVFTVELDMDAVYAHLLTHGPSDDGEPLPVAA